MSFEIEIINTFAPEKSCNVLLYTPVESELNCVETRRYHIEFSGDEEKLRAFAIEVLADPVSEKIHTDESPALDQYRFYIDVSLKKGCLDLEKEYILKFFHELEAPGFEITDLLVTRRHYLIGQDESLTAERFVKDIVNPVIHTWDVAYASH